LENQLRARSKPHFELRDFKYSHNSLGRTNNDALLFRAYARNSNLRSIVDIARDYIQRRYPELRLKVSGIRHYERKTTYPNSSSFSHRPDEWQSKFKRHYEEYGKNDSGSRTGFTSRTSEWIKKRSYKDYRSKYDYRSPSSYKRPCYEYSSTKDSY